MTEKQNTIHGNKLQLGGVMTMCRTLPPEPSVFLHRIVIFPRKELRPDNTGRRTNGRLVLEKTIPVSSDAALNPERKLYEANFFSNAAFKSASEKTVGRQ